MKKLILLAFVFSFQILSQPAHAWDGVGHRITALIALHHLSEDTQNKLLEIIASHPRYEEDFNHAMPASVRRGSNEQQGNWIIGQAAFWPDIARRLPDEDREKYNKPSWHYTDGAWNRGIAQLQGNLYINVDRFPDIPGEAAPLIKTLANVHNISTALDYNTAVLSKLDSSPAQKAIALCWVLHLMSDIHQPLHTGSLYSTSLFRTGDRGGNGISIGRNNLHGTWDSALSEEGVQASVEEILLQISSNPKQISASDSNWDLWLHESRQLLLSEVYSADMLEAIRLSDRENTRLRSFKLSQDYTAKMKKIARERLGLAGLRLAIWFENELP